MRKTLTIVVETDLPDDVLKQVTYLEVGPSSLRTGFGIPEEERENDLHNAEYYGAEITDPDVVIVNVEVTP